MSLRARIFTLFGGAIAVLLGAQWWLVTSLRSELRAETAKTALEVGGSVLVALAAPVRAIPLVPALRADAPAELEVEVGRAPAEREAEGMIAKLRIAGEPTEKRFDLVVPLQRLRPVSGAGAPTPDAGTSLHRIPVPTAGVDALGRDFQARVLSGSLVVLALGLALAAWLAHRLTAPLRALATAATAIGDGRFGTEAPQVGEPRLDATIEAFNRMSHRLAELDARARAAQAREHLTELGEIARGIAHSLRNPLHLVGLTLTELGDDATPAASRARAAGTATAQLERIDRTLRSFLQMSAGRLGPAEPVDLFAIAQDVALEAMQRAGPSLQVELLPCPQRPRLDGHPAEIRSALQALVVNAVEAAPPGSTVTIRVEPVLDGARFCVDDEGPGLPESVRSRLFQPHVTTKEQGAGFGLFLAERIASGRYRGALELADRAPHGTRATLTLRPAQPELDG
jgi:signal transduction histidine kinase